MLRHGAGRRETEGKEPDAYKDGWKANEGGWVKIQESHRAKWIFRDDERYSRDWD